MKKHITCTYVRIHTHVYKRFGSSVATIGHSQHMYTLSHLSLKFLCKGIEVQVSEFVRSDQNILHCGTRVALIPSLTPDTNPRKNDTRSTAGIKMVHMCIHYTQVCVIEGVMGLHKISKFTT